VGGGGGLQRHRLGGRPGPAGSVKKRQGRRTSSTRGEKLVKKREERKEGETRKNKKSREKRAKETLL